MTITSFSTHAKSYTTECFAHHVKESIVINSVRKPIYSYLTNGESDKIFNFLIGAERISLIPASYYDWRAKKYQENGVPLFCYEFKSMNSTPDFDPDRRVIPKETFEPFDWKSVERNLKLAVDRRSVIEVKRVTMKAIRDLEAYPSYYFMLRHMLESVYRFAYFLPMQEEAALAAGLKSPRDLTFGMIKLHLLSLVSSYQVDQWSAPIQKEGIPILCSELPTLLDDLVIEESLT